MTFAFRQQICTEGNRCMSSMCIEQFISRSVCDRREVENEIVWRATEKEKCSFSHFSSFFLFCSRGKTQERNRVARRQGRRCVVVGKLMKC